MRSLAVSSLAGDCLLATAALLLAATCPVGCDTAPVGTPAHLLSECFDCEPEDADRCLDSIDNDEDGLLDCDDPDCAWVAACPWEGPENTDIRCGDGLDNDGNSFTDCADFACSDSTACKAEVQTDEDTLSACTNGVDDDWDGFIDCSDYSCELFCE